MIDFTPLSRALLARYRTSDLLAAGAMCHDREQALDVLRHSQERLLDSLLREGARTAYGRLTGMEPGMDAAAYASRVPMVEYEEIRPLVTRMMEGEHSVLWPGRVWRYAQSSGTSGGKSKYIPVTRRGLQGCHYRGTRSVVSHYLHNNPASHIMAGRALILGGSFANELHGLRTGVKVGDLSAHLIDAMPRMAGLLRVPSRRTALMADWHAKLPRLVSEVSRRQVTNLSGVPSWMMTVMKEVLALTGASNIKEVWPQLEVFFHGGIAFGPYVAEYERLMGSHINYMETYNASEGFFALQHDPSSHAMMLLMDNDNYYELLAPGATAAIPVWEAVEGEVYELIVTNSNGLWRYRMGDTVKVESVAPLTITIAGRTMQYINAFGEELMVHNAEAAIEAACRATGASIANYTAAPQYATQGHKGRHEWLVEWSVPPRDRDEWTRLLDSELRRLNSDYDAKRSGDIFLAPPRVVTLPRGTFNRWLQSTGKLGGQRKVPRLSPGRRFVDAILAMVSKERRHNKQQ